MDSPRKAELYFVIIAEPAQLYFGLGLTAGSGSLMADRYARDTDEQAIGNHRLVSRAPMAERSAAVNRE